MTTKATQGASASNQPQSGATARVSLIISVISLVASLFTSWYTIRWNPKKATHDTLLAMVEVDHFPLLLDKFHSIVPEEQWADQGKDYSNLPDLPADKKMELERVTWSILDMLEALSVNVNSGVLDDNIAYDYLVRYAIRFYEWGKPFIESKRKLHHEPKLFENLETLAKRWEIRRKQELK